MKLFNTNNIEIVKRCQQEFCFSLYQVSLCQIFLLAKLDIFVRIFLSKDSYVCKLLYFVILPATDVCIFSRVYLCVGLTCVRTAVFHILFVS